MSIIVIKRIVFFIFLILELGNVYCQNLKDSLLIIIEETKDPVKKIELYLDLHYEINRENPSLGQSYAEKAIELASKNNEKFLLAKANYRLGYSKHYLGKFEESLEHFTEAEKYFEKEKSLKWLSMTYMEKAWVYTKMLLYDDALKYNIQALELSTKVKDTLDLAKIYNNLGHLYKEKNQLNDAEESYLKAYQLAEAYNYKPALSALANNLGLIYMELEDYELAQKYFEKSLEVKKTLTKDKLGLTRVYGNLGVLFQKKGEYTKALFNFEKSIQIAKEFGSIDTLIESTINKASCLTELDRHSESLNLISNLLNDYSQELNLEMKVAAYRELSLNNQFLNNYTEALKNSNLLIKLNDSLYNKKISLAKNELEAKYKNEQKAKEISILKSKAQQQELQIIKQTQQRNFFVGIGILLLIAFAALFVLFKNKQKLNDKLRELDNVKSNFFTTISHELRTPLSLIKGPLEELNKSREQLNNEQLIQLDLIKNNTGSLSNLIDQVFELSKLESGTITTRLVPIDNFGFVQSLVEGYTFLAKKKEIIFIPTISDLEHTILLDIEISQKIIWNILSNAIKYCPSGGIIKANFLLKENQFYFEISNTGSWIKEEQITNIFNKFYQLDDQHPGIGLGLYLVKQWVDLLNGKIEVVNQKTNGVTFICSIPIISNTSIETKSNSVTTGTFTGNTLSVNHNNEFIDQDNTELPLLLIVDDNLDMVSFLTEILKNDYQITSANDGLDAEKIAFRHIPDLILCDIMMPIKNGLELCESLKNDIRTSHIPFILLTAKSGEENEVRGVQHGADDYILKPFNSTLLKSKIKNLIELRESLKEKYAKELIFKPLEASMPSDEQKFLTKLQEVFAENLMDSAFTAEKFAAKMNLSRMQLHRKIKALTGLSASNFVKTERLKLAAKLLEGPHESISGIGYQVGFNDHAYFSKNFKDLFNCSPTEYASRVHK